MTNEDGTETYRFMCTYYRIPRDIAGQTAEWRGWIALVPDEPAKVDKSLPSRIWYRGIDDIPRAIRQLLDMGDDDAPSAHFDSHEKLRADK